MVLARRPRRSTALAWVVAAAASVVALVACAEDAIDAGAGGAPATATGTTSTGGGTGAQTGGGGDGGAGSSASTYSSGVGPAPTEESACLDKIYECGDLEDNDGDGLVDYQDPDCLGPCDNTEDSLFGGIPGQEGDACRVDCYFDFDSGQGNDGCVWSHECDPNEVAPDYYPEPEHGDRCEYDPDARIQTGDGQPKGCDELFDDQTEECDAYCGPLTPNGCDCFGCCELPAGSGAFVWLGSRGADGEGVCTLDAIDDPTVCHPCLPVAACLNACDPCELCVGKPVPSDGCGGASTSTTTGAGGGGGQCAEGVQPCGLEGQELCPSGFYCITGCCQPVVN